MRARSIVAVSVLAANLFAAENASGTPVIVGEFNPGVVTDPLATAIVGVEWNGTNLVLANSAWTGQYYVTTTTGTELAEFDPPGITPGDPAWDGTALWYDDEFDATVRRIDMAGNVLASFSSSALSQFRMGLAWDGTNLWGAASGGIIHKLTIGGAILASFTAPAANIGSLVWASGTLWAAGSDGTLYDLSVSGLTLTTNASYNLGVPCCVDALAFDGFYLYATMNTQPNAIDRVYQIALVPEPGTLMMTLVGIAAIARRSRRTKT